MERRAESAERGAESGERGAESVGVRLAEHPTPGAERCALSHLPVTVIFFITSCTNNGELPTPLLWHRDKPF